MTTCAPFEMRHLHYILHGALADNPEPGKLEHVFYFVLVTTNLNLHRERQPA